MAEDGEFEMTEDEFDRRFAEGEPAANVGMLWKYDPEVNAGYVRLRPGDVARTVAVDAAVNLDLDPEGRLLGVEILGRDYPGNPATFRSTTGASNAVSVTLDFPGVVS